MCHRRHLRLLWICNRSIDHLHVTFTLRASIDGASGLIELIKKLCIKCEKNNKDKMQDCSDKLISNQSNASRNFFDVANELFTGSVSWHNYPGNGLSLVS